jgi:hypothetical protein
MIVLETERRLFRDHEPADLESYGAREAMCLLASAFLLTLPQESGGNDAPPDAPPDLASGIIASTLSTCRCLPLRRF